MKNFSKTLSIASTFGLLIVSSTAHAGEGFSPTLLKTIAGYGCLDIDKGSSVGGGHNVITWSRCHGGSNQLWSSSGETIQSGSLCLQTYQRNMIAKTCDGSAAQKWSVNSRGAIKSESGKCLDVVAKSNGGAHNVIPYSCHGGKNQIWAISKADKGTKNTTTTTTTTTTKRPKDIVVIDDWSAPYAVRIDCLVSGADNEETQNRIRVTWYDQRGIELGSVDRNGISTCHYDSKNLSFANHEWRRELSRKPAYVEISIDGDDGFLMDQIEMYEGDKRVRTHGENDSRGWCLSTDNTDHNKGNFNGHSVDSQCPSTRRFAY